MCVCVFFLGGGGELSQKVLPDDPQIPPAPPIQLKLNRPLVAV